MYPDIEAVAAPRLSADIFRYRTDAFQQIRSALFRLSVPIIFFLSALFGAYIELQQGSEDLFNSEKIFFSLLYFATLFALMQSLFFSGSNIFYHTILSLCMALEMVFLPLSSAAVSFGIAIFCACFLVRYCLLKTAPSAPLDASGIEFAAKYRQLRDQFRDQKHVLEDTRRQLFEVQGRELVLQRKLIEAEHAVEWGSIQELRDLFCPKNEQAPCRCEALFLSYESIIEQLLLERQACQEKTK